MAYTQVFELTVVQGTNELRVTGPGTAGTYTVVDGDRGTDHDNNDQTQDVAPGETVIVNGTAMTYHGYTPAGGLIVTSGGNYFLYANSTPGSGSVVGNTPQGTTTYIVCFLAGTLIATPAGERPIETLAIGDVITLASGEEKPIKWVGRQTVALHRFNRHSASPILIRAGALGGGLPKRDLYTSYRHGFALEGVLVIAGLLVNGKSIVQCTEWPEESVTMYQIEVDGHELLLAEGAASETFGEDGDNRALFDNADEYHALYPDAQPVEPMALGRVIVARQLPRAVKERIAAAAADLARAAQVA